MNNFKKITEFADVHELRSFLEKEQINIGLSDSWGGSNSATARKCESFGRTLGNRWAILPMEGWDCGNDGVPGEFTRRRWLRFAISGAKLIYGTEAGAVTHTGRSNPQQLLVCENTLEPLKKLCSEMRAAHRALFGTDDDLAIGLQLTHSGRFSHPNDRFKLEPVTAWAHPLLDKKFGCAKENVASDNEIREIIRCFIKAASVAGRAGFDFVDIKHAHGYFGHELLSAIERPGPYGGSFENRTRFFREIADGILKECPGLEISARLSIFDIFPFEKGPDGVGRPMQWTGEYPYAFGGDGSGMEMDDELKEPVKFIEMMRGYGVKTICASVGSPYYNPHFQRPAYFPVADGYEMPVHPLANAARHIKAVARLRELCPGLLVVGSGYSCLQDYLPNAAEYAVGHGLTDFAGIGRMALSYPEMPSDILAGRPLRRMRICRTIGDCTNAPRHGLVSGCYPLDELYRKMPEAAKLRELKKNAKQ